ncbi:MAG: hypothetical protein HY694_14860 [Deltaproteobacteria bacterium]|nr:hypothetical protein [Deltaproteobacteria bacterium]
MKTKEGGVKTAVFVFTVPLLAKEGLGEVDYDPGLQPTWRTRGTERAAEQRK